MGAPLGPWGASRELPGGGSRPNVCGPEHGKPSWFWHRFLCRFWHRFLIVLGSFWGLSWGSSSIIWAPWSAQVGHGTVFVPSYHRKSDFHETSAGVMFGAFPGPQESTQNDPRSTQDGSKIVLDQVFGLLIFRFDF